MEKYIECLEYFDRLFEAYDRVGLVSMLSNVSHFIEQLKDLL